jgi:general secretion pathway protein M
MIGAAIKQSALYQQLLQRLLALEPRERVLVIVLAVFLLALFLYFKMLEPSIEFAQAQQQRYTKLAADLQWMRDNAPSKPMVEATGSDESLAAAIGAAAQNSQFQFQRYDNLDEGRIRVVIEQQSFKALLKWLQLLERDYAVTIQEIAVDKQADNGVVNARVLLQR